VLSRDSHTDFKKRRLQAYGSDGLFGADPLQAQKGMLTEAGLIPLLIIPIPLPPICRKVLYRNAKYRKKQIEKAAISIEITTCVVLFVWHQLSMILLFQLNPSPIKSSILLFF